MNCLTRSHWGIRPERRTASSGNRQRACAAASLSVSAPGCRCSRMRTFAPSPAMMRSIWNYRASSRALITASRAIRTVPLISCLRCSCRSFLSNSSAMPTKTVRAAVCRFPFMCLARSFAPAASFQTSAERSPSSAPEISVCPACSRISPVCKTAIQTTNGRKFSATATCSCSSAVQMR